MTVDKMTVDKMTIDKMIVDKMTVDKKKTVDTIFGYFKMCCCHLVDCRQNECRQMNVYK
jgi:hypothetical protein